MIHQLPKGFSNTYTTSENPASEDIRGFSRKTEGELKHERYLRFPEGAQRERGSEKLFKVAKEPASIEEAAELYADIAAKTGTSIPKDAILAFLKEKEVSQQAQSAKAEGAVKQALDEEALDAVAGGDGGYVKHNTACDTTFDPGEWCWFSDSCSLVISYYDDGVGAPINTKPWTEDDEKFATMDDDTPADGRDSNTSLDF